MKDEKIIDIRHKGRDVTIYRKADGTYSAYVDGRETQWDLDTEAVLRWLSNMAHDDS